MSCFIYSNGNVWKVKADNLARKLKEGNVLSLFSDIRPQEIIRKAQQIAEPFIYDKGCQNISLNQVFWMVLLSLLTQVIPSQLYEPSLQIMVSCHKRQSTTGVQIWASEDKHMHNSALKNPGTFFPSVSAVLEGFFLHILKLDFLIVRSIYKQCQDKILLI